MKHYDIIFTEGSDLFYNHRFAYMDVRSALMPLSEAPDNIFGIFMYVISGNRKEENFCNA